MGIHFQRNRFVGAAAQETCNVLGGEFFQSQLFVLDDADEFTEQEPVRECLVGNHCVHEREYCAVAAPKPFPSDFGIDDAEERSHVPGDELPTGCPGIEPITGDVGQFFSIINAKVRGEGFRRGNSTIFKYVDKEVAPEAFTHRLLLRELVRVVQYEKLGLKEFAAKYVTGFLSGGSYEAIPLEMNAHELDDRCAAATTKAFSVADEVQRWIDTRRF